MADPTDPPAEPASTSPTPEPPPAPNPHRRGWQRAATYAGSIAVVLALWICGTLYSVRYHPERLVHDLLARVPFPSSYGRVYWENRRTLRIEDVKIGGFFYADAIVVVASPVGLIRHHIAKVQILGGQLFTKPLYAAMDQLGPTSGEGLDWVIGRLEISRGTLMLDNLVADTSIPVRLGVRNPLIFKGLRLGKPDNSPEMTAERVADIVNVNIVSPIDPTSPVFAFPLTRIHFTYSEIWHHHIREIDMVHPTMFLGEDLFWLSGEFKKENKTVATQGPASPWSVGHLELQYGQLAVNAFGQPVVHFPFFFNTQVDDVRLDQLDQISAKSVIAIQRLDQDYPDYKIRLVGLTGRLYFSWPPTDAAANNVVNTISIQEVSWNNIAATDVSTNVTFDPNGVYGRLHGKCEGGNLDGNFEFYYTKGFTWNANFFADKISCQPIAEKIAGKYCDLSGVLNGKIAVQGRTTEILSCSGLLDLPDPGVLQIKSASALLDRLPADTIAIKREALSLAINALKSYPYDSGQLKLDYKPGGGTGTLHLTSPLGQRLFQIYLHPLADNPPPKPGH